MFGKLISVVLLATTIALNAEAQVQDTINNKTPLFVGKDALLLGAYTIGTVAVAPLDIAVAKRLQYKGTQENRFLRRAATGFRVLAVPGSVIAGVGLYGIGRAQGQRRLQSLGLHSVESILIADVLGGTIKFTAGRARPYVDIDNPADFQLFRGLTDHKYQSFPSGHTINAFAFASTVTRETQFWWPHSAWYVGTVMYGGATLMGLSRIYNNQHWASDVMAGAAIGTLIGVKVVKYTHSHPGNRIDKRFIRGGQKSVLQPIPLVISFQF
ncbi:MAG: phosphatase PAP2 family protein [Gemmatimonadota bacterium]|nr:phosphatase PAP2 family protein [Gemmatimonadota bacterium]